MNIVGKVKVEGYMRAQDIDCGECFVFQDDDTLMMRVDDYIVNVACGEVVGDVYDSAHEDRPVVEVETELCIVKKMMSKERD